MENVKNKKYAATMALIMGTLAMLVSFMAWSSIAPLATAFAPKLGFEAGSAAQKMLVAVPVLLGSIARIPMGILSDRLGGKKVYLALMVFTLIPLLIIPHVHSYSVMLWVALLLGMAGTSFAVAISYVSVWFPAEKQGLVLGIAGMGNIGNAVSALILPTIIGANKDISKAYTFLVILMVIFIILFAVLTKEMPTDKNKTIGQALSVAKEKDTWYLSLFYMLTFGSFMAFGNLIPTLIGKGNVNHFVIADSPAKVLVVAGFWAAGFSAVATLLRPVGGMLADKILPKKLLMLVFGGVLISTLILAAGSHSFAILMTGIFVLAVFAGIGNGVVFKMVPYVSKKNTGAVTGFVGAIGGLGGFIYPFVVAGIGNLKTSFLVLTAFTILCAIVLYLVFFRGGDTVVENER
ncbi:nitrate/nitrite transporter [Lactococcus termiticola]|uniref:Major facilitator superfamily transporter n=1 Tax=Lactococcus termiticola TaxID=2169526 RepID=A0A2R5HHB2_9LACT|nr:MFS transporter [Lactococcus termiticola]GBG96735.1 major facilitator superfamily transporter [Lactococcus termiticola]